MKAMNLGVYLVTDEALCGARGVVETVRQAVLGGATIVQLRDKHADLDGHLRQLEQLAEVTFGLAQLVVNDRLDVAIAARERGIPLDGVHLGQGDDAVLQARDALGPDAIVGLTANAPEHLVSLAELPAGTVDYLGAGVIHPTTTKPNHPPALGVSGFRAFRDASPVPVVAIGGIGLADVASLRAAGAAGICVVSAICAADDAEAAAREFRATWQGQPQAEGGAR